MVNNPLITGLKIEMGELALKTLVLSAYAPGSNPDDYEEFFYLAEDGSPTFVVQQLDVAVAKDA